MTHDLGNEMNQGGEDAFTELPLFLIYRGLIGLSKLWDNLTQVGELFGIEFL